MVSVELHDPAGADPRAPRAAPMGVVREKPIWWRRSASGGVVMGEGNQRSLVEVAIPAAFRGRRPRFGRRAGGPSRSFTRVSGAAGQKLASGRATAIAVVQTAQTWKGDDLA